MKKNILWIVLLLLFASCEEETPRLEFPNNSSVPVITFSSEAGSTSFHISTNKHWNIAMPATWCQNEIKDGRPGEVCHAITPDFWSSLSSYSGNPLNGEITISVAENQSYYRRRYDFYVNAGDLSKLVIVEQEGKPYLEVEYPHYDVAATFTSYPRLQIILYAYVSAWVTMESNAEWIGTGSAGYDIVPVDDKVRYRMDISVENNPSPTPREAILTFTQGSLSKTVTVRQAGAE